MKSPSIRRRALSSNASAHSTGSSLTEGTIVSGLDLYTATPPAYTPAISEADIDRKHPPELVDPEPLADVRSRAEVARAESISSFAATEDISVLDGETPPYFFPCGDSCAILPEEPAEWKVKDTDIKLSTKATKVLLQCSMLKIEELECIAVLPKAPESNSRPPNPDTPPRLKSRPTESWPTDPITGAASAAFETATGVVMGLAAGPLEAIHQVQTSKSISRNHSHSILDDQRRPNPYDKVAIGTAKGLGRVAGAALKAPVLVTTNVSMGFHNVPRLYGDNTVREVKRVESAKDGVIQAGKGFGTGLYDGITGLFTQPLNGFKKEGALGCLKGFGRGIGGVVCKPAAGAVGIPAYTLLGLWREGEKLGDKRKKSQLETRLADGDEGYSEEVMSILARWVELTNKEKAE